MREVLDRIHEAETALDRQLTELYYATELEHRQWAITLCWKAKQNLWYASMHTLNAAAGPEPPHTN